MTSLASRMPTIMEFAGEGMELVSNHPIAAVIALIFYLLLAIAAIFSFRWLIWMILSLILGLTQLVYAVYQLGRIGLTISVMSSFKFWVKLTGAMSSFVREHNPHTKILHDSQSYEEYESRRRELEEKSPNLKEWKETDDGFAQANLLRKTTSQLRSAREQNRLSDLQFLLSGLLKRNHLGIHEEELYQQSVSETKDVIEEFQAEVEKCLRTLTESSELSMEEKLALAKKEKRSLGQTAVCLSGGGSICMYHIGVVKALIQAGLYKDIKVFSGASGGSITAAMVASRTEEELIKDVFLETVSTDFTLDGKMAEGNIHWFPPVREQMVRFMKQRVLVDNEEFRRCTKFYYADMTFAEAYERTRKHVSITVSMSQQGGGSSGPRRLLLNHITSPHVTLASAVAASCSLPGIMRPNKLEAKNKDGRVVPFEVDGVDFIDGSIRADLPFKRMATMFNVSNFIVSQVNFHAAPFLRKHHSPSKDSLYWQILSFLELDIRSRAQALAKLGLLPTFFGQNMSGVFKQKYHGDVTIVPKFTPAESFGLKAVMNPEVVDMRHYIRGGQQATWPHVNQIRHMMRTEKILRDCMASVRKQVQKSEFQSLKKNFSFTNLDEDGLDSDEEEDDEYDVDSDNTNRESRFALRSELRRLRARHEELIAENEALKRLMRDLGNQALVAANRGSSRLQSPNDA